jgi:hypothetical protein
MLQVLPAQKPKTGEQKKKKKKKKMLGLLILHSVGCSHASVVRVVG